MPIFCPECGLPAVIMDSSKIYGCSYGPVWACSSWPACDTYVGCHRGTERPLGTMAGATVRLARRKAHRAFDAIWRTNRLTREAAYRRLGDFMGLCVDACHIGRFDVAQCERVLTWAESFGVVV